MENAASDVNNTILVAIDEIDAVLKSPVFQSVKLDESRAKLLEAQALLIVALIEKFDSDELCIG